MSYRRSYDGVRRRHGSAKAVAWWLLAMSVMVILAAAEAIVAHTVVLVLLAGAAVAGAYVLGRRRGPAGPRVFDAARLRAERDDLRRQVAKLEDDAARHDGLVERLERVTRRPVELHLADLERAQRIYGPATIGKSGRRP